MDRRTEEMATDRDVERDTSATAVERDKVKLTKLGESDDIEDYT